MKALVVGATGATGIWVVKKLLEKEIETTVLVRDPEKMRNVGSTRLKVIQNTVLAMPFEQLQDLISQNDTVISCLGHTISMKGIFGKPRLLVTDSITKICEALGSTGSKYKILLMNTTANQNKELKENYSMGDKIVLGLLGLILPPQRDNVKAAKYLQERIGKSGKIEWVIVRPDTLIDETEAAEYAVYGEIQRSPVFDAGKVSRMNVGDFMVRLATDEKLWEKWKYRMPVVYNTIA